MIWLYSVHYAIMVEHLQFSNYAVYDILFWANLFFEINLFSIICFLGEAISGILWWSGGD